MNDVEKAIDYFYIQMENGNIKSDRQQEVYELAIKALDKQLNNKWIPVLERLPEENGFYIFQLIGGKIHEYYYENEKLYVDNIHDESYLFDIEKITAWKPLPEPYKGCE